MAEALNQNSKIALVCKGGPENGPFSAMAGRIIYETLKDNGLKISGIYACSGSTPTALLGCTYDFPKLCDVWANLTPVDIVGKTGRIKTISRVIRSESILTSHALGSLITGSWDLDKIFSDKAIMAKFPAVDILSNEYIIFSNKVSGHKRWFKEGVLGSMGLIPFLQPQFIYEPEKWGLIEKEKARVLNDGKDDYTAMILIDGGYGGNMLLEEAMRDVYDHIFLIDVHGLIPTKTELNVKYHWTNLIRVAQHLLSNTNDIRQFQTADRINEEIRIKDMLNDLAGRLPSSFSRELSDIVARMNNGRLRLHDKKEAVIHMVSNNECAGLFNFSKFTQEEVLEIMYAGAEAAVGTLKSLKCLKVADL